eukprot:TRINITY_DN910_c2_g1_i3.p1 TRINITY_DN910_c2_g1~~TRINITY_DN910_c2_g1_i3.p1  ORF type:complete len:131 (-),score=28.98 TRINITY_DN910_c2_g1_i3:11-403(-)
MIRWSYDWCDHDIDKFELIVNGESKALLIELEQHLNRQANFYECFPEHPKLTRMKIPSNFTNDNNYKSDNKNDKNDTKNDNKNDKTELKRGIQKIKQNESLIMYFIIHINDYYFHYSTLLLLLIILILFQ